MQTLVRYRCAKRRNDERSREGLEANRSKRARLTEAPELLSQGGTCRTLAEVRQPVPRVGAPVGVPTEAGWCTDGSVNPTTGSKPRYGRASSFLARQAEVATSFTEARYELLEILPQ